MDLGSYQGVLYAKHQTDKIDGKLIYRHIFTTKELNICVVYEWTEGSEPKVIATFSPFKTNEAIEFTVAAKFA
jgi:hypothetical protein